MLQPFAWQSREALRKLIIGKPVQYIVDYDVPTIGREFGRIQFKGEGIIMRLVTDGFLKTRLSSGQQRTLYVDQRLFVPLMCDSLKLNRVVTMPTQGV